MSRSQETSAYNTATSQNAQNYAESQASEKQTQADIGNYGSALAKYAASNPYVSGGEFQTAQNEAIADSANSTSAAGKAALQDQAVRTGQNPAAANAASEEIARGDERAAAGQQATAAGQRIGSEADYNTNVVNDASKQEQMQEQLAGLQSGAGNQELDTETKAGETPSFGDTFGDAFGSALGSGLGKLAIAGGAAAACWVAAELYGGWNDPRVVLLRHWLFGPYAASGWIPLLLTSLYARFGERAADLIRTHKLPRRILKRVFDAALRRAEEWKAQEAALVTR